MVTETDRKRGGAYESVMDTHLGCGVYLRDFTAHERAKL